MAEGFFRSIQKDKIQISKKASLLPYKNLSLVLVAKFSFVVHQPFNGAVNTALHIFLLFVSELKETLRSVSKSLFDIEFNFLKDFAFDVFLDFFLRVLSFFESFVQDLIITPHDYDQVKPFRWKYCRTVEIDNDPSVFNTVLFLDKVYQHVFVKDGYIEFIIPLIVEFVFLDKLADRKVLKIEGLVEKLAESGFASARSPSDQDVGSLVRDVALFFLHHLMLMILKYKPLFIYWPLLTSL
jgi:hypothetical protein